MFGFKLDLMSMNIHLVEIIAFILHIVKSAWHSLP
jgi:hypothetical protein